MFESYEYITTTLGTCQSDGNEKSGQLCEDVNLLVKDGSGQLCEDVNLLVKDYRQDVDTLIGEVNQFLLYTTDSYPDKECFCFCDLYVTVKDNIHIVFPALKQYCDYF
jgi:hypothetical protein